MIIITHKENIVNRTFTKNIDNVSFSRYIIVSERGDILKDRIRTIRKTLGLTQTDFGAKIGVKGNTITNYETGLRTPSDAVIISICREFDVNEAWLRTGHGEMFLQLNEDAELDKLFAAIQLSDDEFIKSLLRAYWRLPQEKKAVIWELIENIQTKK